MVGLERMYWQGKAISERQKMILNSGAEFF